MIYEADQLLDGLIEALRKFTRFELLQRGDTSEAFETLEQLFDLTGITVTEPPSGSEVDYDIEVY